MMNPLVESLATDGVIHSTINPHGRYLVQQERHRMEWRLVDGGDPAQIVTDFFTDAGLPVTTLGNHRGKLAGHCPRTGVLFVSAAAAAVMIGASPGAANPCAALPDLVAVVYEHSTADLRPPHRLGAVDPAWQVQRWRSSWSPAQHAAAIHQAQAAIARGDVYQVNLVGHACATYHGDPLPALRRVAALPGACYPALLSGPGWAIACASPETLVQVVDGQVLTRPIKGTRPATPTGRQELLTSPKERAEHIMIVDLARNDLAQVARTGTVTVQQLYAIRQWCDLWQAESTIGARLRADVGLADLLRAMCPGGSVTGAPKRAALELIAALEPVGRGPSMGAWGWITPTSIDLGLSIRTVAADGHQLHAWAGGGITWSSDPAAEITEAAAKAAPLQAALAAPATTPSVVQEESHTCGSRMPLRWSPAPPAA